MEVLQDGFVDGCSVTLLDHHVRPSTVKIPPNIVDVLVQTMAHDPGMLDKELMLVDHSSSVFYLTLPMDEIPGLTGSHKMILWRHERIFSADDVTAAKLMIQMFRAPFQAAASGAVVASRSRFRDALHDSELLMATLDAIPDIVIICNSEGDVLERNAAASKCWGSIKLRDPDNSHFQNCLKFVCHPDDLQCAIEVWAEASHGNLAKKLRCRILVFGLCGQITW
jgi:hypothetical protein